MNINKLQVRYRDPNDNVIPFGYFREQEEYIEHFRETGCMAEMENYCLVKDPDIPDRYLLREINDIYNDD